MHRISIAHGRRKCRRFQRIHEQPNVLPNAILLIDHAKPHPRIPPIEIAEHFVQRATLRRHSG